MKHLNFILFILISSPCLAQWNYDNQNIIYSSGGNVGIGATNPQVRLDLGTTSGNGLQFRDNTTTDYRIRLTPYWNTNDDTRLDFNFERTATAGLSTIMSVGYKSNVGIGTTSPDARLTLQNSATGLYSGILFKDGVLDSRGAIYYNGAHNFVIDALSLPGGIDLSTFKIRTGGNDRFSISRDGNVGIGTNTPSQKLDVNGIVNASSFYVNGVPFAGGGSQWTTSGSKIIYNATNGSVGIGTPFTSNPNNYKLAVNGIIGAKEVLIESQSSTWADYVFKSDYKLMPLSEVEAFVKQNQHLPEIPSALEIERDGHKLAQVQILLLKKIEELTLYILEQEKRIQALESNNQGK